MHLLRYVILGAMLVSSSVTAQDSLSAIERVLYEGRTASETIALGVIRPEEWVGVTLCPVSLWQIATWQEMTYPVLKEFEAARRSGAVKKQREIVLGLLSEARRQELAAFRSRLGVAARALRAGSIARPPRAECLCP